MTPNYTLGKFLALILACAIATSGLPERSERRLSSEDSVPKSLSFSNNEFTSEPRRKVSHMLVGGHLKATSRTDPTDVEDDDDEAAWDDGLIIASAGNGKEKKTGRAEDDEEKKTLSQQVKEGKYGLIQNEIYPTRPKRPGIISYLSNPEVPKDNAKNLGGLDEEEIWLAENHVLVLRGGKFPDHETENAGSNGGNRDDWSPIDDYKAPRRQVKIPSRPKVPPPFPVQLSENGPVHIIGANGGSAGDGSSGYESDSSYGKGFLPGEGPFFAVPKNSTPEPDDQTSQENSTKESSVQDRRTKSGRVPTPKGAVGPFYPALPPGAVFVMPPGNQFDYDEDDQSIYYPPPYSFTYKQDTSTPVPPGPLVPGIILPPPPDFFSGVEEKKSTAKTQHIKYPKRPSTTPLPRSSSAHYPSRKSSAKPQKAATGTSAATSTGSTGTVSTTEQAPRATFTMKPVNRMKYKTGTFRSTLMPIRVQETIAPKVEVTTSATTGAKNVVNHFAERSTTRSKGRWTSSVSAKSVPLVSYYASSTPSTILDEPLEATPVSMENVATRRPPTTVNQASYYFYEEASDDGTTPNPTIYYRATTETPYYRLEGLPERGEQPKKSHYGARPTQTQRTPKDYGLELLEPVSKTSSRYRYANSPPTTQSAVSSRHQGQRMLGDSSPVYYDAPTESPQSPRYYTTTKPPNFQNDDRYDYDQASKSKPIYQYSFEAADYFKRQPQAYYKPESQQQSYYKQDNQRPTEAPESFEEWQAISNGDRDEYDGGESLTEQRPEALREKPYRSRLPTYPSSTSRPVFDVTPNPHYVYYTKQDKQLLDDVTKEDFTNFGKKLRGKSLPSTTPIYSKSVVTDRPDYREVDPYFSNAYPNAVGETATYKSPRVNVHYGDHNDGQRPYSLEGDTEVNYKDPRPPVEPDSEQRPYSLEGDTEVNYKDPQPPVEPDSEWIPGFNPRDRPSLPLANYRTQQSQLDNQAYVQRTYADQRLNTVRPYAGQRLLQSTNFVPVADNRDEPRRNYPTRPVSLASDIAVNCQNPRPPINTEAEFFVPVADNRDEPRRNYPTRTVSLVGDIAVNDQHPRPPINTEAEFFVPVADNRDEPRRNYRTRPVSLAGDIAVNYQNPRPSINTEAEFVDPGGDKASYFAYRLPGDSGHFYFLTPQAIGQRQDNCGYLYPRPRDTRLARQRRRGPGNA